MDEYQNEVRCVQCRSDRDVSVVEVNGESFNLCRRCHSDPLSCPAGVELLRRVPAAA
jgi:hypothetical protein